MGKHDKHHKHHKHSKVDKELAKLNETDEEKRARRLAKKDAKAAKQQEDSQVAGYSNGVNPWNDPNLADQFVWGKKVDKDRSKGINLSSSRDAQKRRREELASELEKVKRAREQREIEKEAMEEERAMLDREREQMTFADNEKREDEFQFNQSKVRAHIRNKEGRGRPIDIVCESLTIFEETFDPEDILDIEIQVQLPVHTVRRARPTRCWV